MQSIPRHRHLGRKAALAAMLLIALAAMVLVALKQETIEYMFNPGQIAFAGREEIVASVFEGDFPKRSLVGDEQELSVLSYYSPDESVYICTTFSEGEVERVSGEVYTASLMSYSVGDAMALAETMLAPYLDKPAIEALEAILVGKFMQSAMSNTMNMSVTVGKMSVHASGDTVGGTIRFTVVTLP